MKTILLLAALAAAAPPAFAPEPALADLKAAGQRDIAAVNTLLSTPIERERVPVLRAATSEIVASGTAAQNALVALAGHLAGPANELESAARKAGAMDDRYEEAQSARRLAHGRLQKKRDDVERLKKDDAKTKACKDALASAQSTYATLEGALARLDEARSKARRDAVHARASRLEFAVQADIIERENAALPGAAQALAARLDALGPAGDAESRGRVYQALDPLLDPARRLYGAVNAAVERLPHFRDDYAAYVKAAKAFTEEEAATTQAQGDMDKAILDVAYALSQVKDYAP